MLPDPSGAGSLSPTPGLADPGNRVERREARHRWHSDRRRPRAATPPVRSARSRRPDAAALLPAPARGRHNRAVVGRGWHRFVHVRSGLQQDADDVRLPFAHGEEQRREPGGERRAEIGSRLDEHPPRLRRGLRPPPTSGPSARAALLRVDVGAARRAAPSPTPSLPVRAAVISAVSPPGSAAFGSAPASSNSSTIAPLPFVQASESGVTP